MKTNHDIYICFRRLALLLVTAATFSANAQAQEGKEYYFRNVETGKWLGPGNNWGTQASLLLHPYWNKLKVGSKDGSYATDTTLPTGTYVLESQVQNGNGQIYLGGADDNPFLDNVDPWTLNITRTADGRYTIQKDGGSFYGSKATAPYFGQVGATADYKWRVRSHAQMLEAMKSATASAPMDATFLIKDADFSKNNRDAGAWTFVTPNHPGNISGGLDKNRCAESWISNFTLSQTIKDVPNGIYELKAQGFYRVETDYSATSSNPPKFFIQSGDNVAETPFPHRTGTENEMNAASESFIAGLYYSEPIRVAVTDNTIILGAYVQNNMNLWCVWDNFSLSYLGLTDGETTVDDYGLSYGEKVEAMKVGTSAGSGTDATFMITNPGFDEAGGVGWTMVSENQNLHGGVYNGNYCAESYMKPFSLSQTLKDVPNGIYRMKAQGFYRVEANTSATSDNPPKFFIQSGNNIAEASFPQRAGTENSMTAASTSFSSGLYYIDPLTIIVTDNTITLGAKLEGNSGLWSIWDNFQLEYIAQADDLGDYDTENADIAAMLEATLTPPSANPATFILTNPDFEETGGRGWTMVANAQNLHGGQYEYETGKYNYCAESWRSEFNLSQTVNYIPNGTYRMTAQGFYRQEGTDNDHLPVFFIQSGGNISKTVFPVREGSENTMTAASEQFANGKYTIAPITMKVTNNSLTLGAKLEGNTLLWSIWDNFQLEYLGFDEEEAANYGNDDGDADKAYVEYVGAGETLPVERWLTTGNGYGSKAVLKEHPQYVVRTQTGTNTCTLKSQMTGNNNFGANGAGQIRDPYMDVASPIEITLEPVTGEDDMYYLGSEQTYYKRSDEKAEKGYYYVMGSEEAKWEIFSREQMMANMIKDGSEASPSDATWLIKDHSFGRNNRDRATVWSMVASNQNLEGGDITNQCAESYHATFTLTQVLSNVPNGIYEMKAQGFYRQDGTDNTNLPYFYINGGQTTFPLIAGTENSMNDASASFTNGLYTVAPIRVTVTDGQITLGAGLDVNTTLWCIWDNFELYYLGDPFEKELEANVYYLRNVGAPAGNNWLCSGTRYDTRASLLAHPQFVQLRPQANGTYLIETQIQGEGVYFGDWDINNPFMNKSEAAAYKLNILSTGDGYYTMSYNGLYYGYNPSGEDARRVNVTGATDSGAKWEFLTHQQMIDKMLTGTRANPQDATFLIKDFDFGPQNRYESSWQNRVNVSFGPTSGTDYQHVSRNLESYKQTFDVYQTLTNLPSGIYRMRAQAAVTYFDVIDGVRTVKAYVAGEDAVELYANNSLTAPFKEMDAADQLTNQLQLANSFESGKYWTDWIEVEVTNGQLTIGARNTTRTDMWAVWDSFELEYIGPTEEPTTPYYYADASTSDLWVVPRQSFLADHADNYTGSVAFRHSFLAAGEGWKTPTYGRQVADAVASASGIDAANYAKVQNMSEYTTVHYVKRGEWSPIFLTTNNGTTPSHHDYYQRWYWYDQTAGIQKPLGSDMMAPRFWGYQYQNGIVMGTQLHNGANTLNGNTQAVGFALQVKLPANMSELVIGGDITRYSDMLYANPDETTAAASGNLTEPSLSLRHIYILKDAKEMAAALTAKTGDDWYEEHTIHFPSRTIGIANDHVALDLELRDYWFFASGNALSTNDDDLQNLSGDEFITIETAGSDLGIKDIHFINAPGTNLGVGDISNLYPVNHTETLRRRLISFSYPASGEVTGESQMQILVKAHNPATNEDYNLARFTLIFDADSETLPYMDIVGGDAVRHDRSSQSLRERVGGMDPVAHIDFDFPDGAFFEAPTGTSFFTGDREDFVSDAGSLLPYKFEYSSFSFSTMCSGSEPSMWCTQWGDYSIGQRTHNTEGNYGTLQARPVSDFTGDRANKDLAPGFLFIDASDLPGTVATIPFNGRLCLGSKLMCTGWIASRTNSSPGSVLLRVLGRRTVGGVEVEEEIYAFCPGQVGITYRRASGKSEGPAKDGDYVWQQFYFDFILNTNYDEYWLSVENFCESTQGGDYMLDDIWVFGQVPTVGPDRTTPLCGGDLDVVELQTSFNSLLLSVGATEVPEDGEATAQQKANYMACVYLDWEKFLNDFSSRLVTAGLEANYYTEQEITEKIENGYFEEKIQNSAEYKQIYVETFNDALLRTEGTSAIAYTNYKWSWRFADHPEYSFATMGSYSGSADPNEKFRVYRAGEGEDRMLVFNGSLDVDLEFFHKYAILSLLKGTEPVDLSDKSATFIAEEFNVFSLCSSRALLQFLPKMEVLGTVGAMSIDEVEFCNNTTRTFAMELTGIVKEDEMDLDGDGTSDPYEDADGTHEAGDVVTLPEVYFDWWMGIPRKDTNGDGVIDASDDDTFVEATEKTYKQQYKLMPDGVTKIYLYDAMKAFRFMNPQATSLYSPNIKLGRNPLYNTIPAFTQDMLDYLRELANPADGSAPQLIIHSKLVDIKVSDATLSTETYLDEERQYVKFVAMPIELNINEKAKSYVYICAEPQSFRVRVNGRAPIVREGFSDKQYPLNVGTLSVRVAKSQFEKMRENASGAFAGMLHIPLRGVGVETAEAIGVKNIGTTEGDAVLLVNSTDSIMQDYIMRGIHNLLPPAIGHIDYFKALKDDGYSGTYNERLAKIHFSNDFLVREGYSYTLRMYFAEDFGSSSGVSMACEGTVDIIIKIVPDYQVWTGSARNTDWSNDENWRRADYDELYADNGTTLRNTPGNTQYMVNGEADETEAKDLTTENFVTDGDRERRQGFAPLYCTNILMLTDETAPAPILYDDGMETSGFPALRETSSPLIRYDFQCHEWADIKNEPGNDAKVGYCADGDMVTELYSTNVCNNIVFQSKTELVKPHLLNYQKAWVEYSLSKNRWHLLASPLKDMISGEWYAPTLTAQQTTTYFEPIDFNNGESQSLGAATVVYDRFAPAVYQRAWDKAKAVLYERGAEWEANDGNQEHLDNVGSDDQGQWERVNTQDGRYYQWVESTNADDYLQRLTYKPMGNSKANVAVKGTWSGVYNDHTVPFSGSGFSVMPINNLKDHNAESLPTIFRLPKDDQYYDIWDWGKSYAESQRVRIYINDGRTMPGGATAANTVALPHRGRLRSDVFSPASVDVPGDYTSTDHLQASTTITLQNEGAGGVGYFLVANPFICGLDMQAFFAANSAVVEPYYLMLRDEDIADNEDQLTHYSGSATWTWTDMGFRGIEAGSTYYGQGVVPARYAFFVKAKTATANSLALTFTPDMMVLGRIDRRYPALEYIDDDPSPAPRYFSIRAQRDGLSSEARVEVSDAASNLFRPEEDLETFVVDGITGDIPVVYTLCGRLATSINRLRDFASLPLGIESNSADPVVLTFTGVETTGQHLHLYDALLGRATELKDGTQVSVPGSTQNRYYIIAGEIEKGVSESNIQIMPQAGGARVLSTTAEPLNHVWAYDLSGRLYQHATPGVSDYAFPLLKGAYIIKAETDACRQTKKILVR